MNYTYIFSFLSFVFWVTWIIAGAHRTRAFLVMIKTEQTRVDVTCRRNQDHDVRQNLKRAERLDKFRVDFLKCGRRKAKMGGQCCQSHSTKTKLSQLYSAEKTRDQSSVSACRDREGTSSLTSLGLEKKSGAPWECARWAWDSHFWRGELFVLFYFFTSLPQTPEEPRGPSNSIYCHLFS